MAKLKKKNTKNIKPFDEQNTLLAKGTLGTLHMADVKGNTKAWQNRMGTNKKGQRLYDFGQDIINRINEVP
jgi:hypothetical protein